MRRACLHATHARQAVVVAAAVVPDIVHRRGPRCVVASSGHVAWLHRGCIAVTSPFFSPLRRCNSFRLYMIVILSTSAFIMATLIAKVHTPRIPRGTVSHAARYSTRHSARVLLRRVGSKRELYSATRLQRGYNAATTRLQRRARATPAVTPQIFTPVAHTVQVVTASVTIALVASVMLVRSSHRLAPVNVDPWATPALRAALPKVWCDYRG